MLFQFAPAIQAKIDSGLYEVVRSQATGQLLGLARDKATGQFVGHAVNAVTNTGFLMKKSIFYFQKFYEFIITI